MTRAIPIAWRRPLSLMALAVAAMALSLQGCGQSEATLVSSARQYLEKGDQKAAVIQLKTALQQNPNSGAARLLMGQALLDSGEAASAAIELEKAQAAGVAQPQVVPLWARALLSQGQNDKLIERFGATTLGQDKADAALKAILAAAHWTKGRKDESRQLLEQAIKLDARQPQARLFQAQIAATEGKVDEALKLGQALIDDALEVPAAHVLMGSQILAKEGAGEPAMAKARASFEAALNAKADHVPAHLALLALAARESDAQTQLRERWTAFHKAAPRHPVAMIMEGDYALRDGKLDRARDISTQLLKGLPEDARVQMLAARVAERSGSAVQAEVHAARAMLMAPRWAEPRRMLAQTQVRNGQVKRALETLQPLIEGDQPDADTLSLAGQALLQDGQVERAEKLLRRAAQLKPDDMRLKTLNAIAQLGRANDGAVMVELESIAAQDKGTTADLALLSLRMRGRDFDGALKTVAALKRKMAQDPQALQIEAQVYLLKGDQVQARKSLQAALELKGDYLPAAATLARLDIEAGQDDAARGHFERVLKSNPKSAPAHLALVELQARKGASPGDLRQSLEAAVKAVPEAPSLRLALVDHLLGSAQDKRAALAAAQEANAALADQPELIDALGRAQLANDAKEQATTTFKRLAALQPQNMDFQVRLAESQLAMAEFEEAVRTLRKALEIKDDHLPAQEALVVNLMLLKRQSEAAVVVNTIQKQRPQEPAGWLIEGDMARQMGKLEAALASYRTALGKARNTVAAIRLHTTLLEAGRTAEAQEFAASWERSAPGDLQFAGHLVDRAMQQKSWPDAETRLRAVLKAQPQSVVAMNNLAYTLIAQRKPGALELAERANQLQPGVPALMDTLALALSAERQHSRAVEIQKQALLRAGDDPSLKLTLARIYLDAGDKASARRELEQLAGLGERFDQQPEVGKLLKSL